MAEDDSELSKIVSDSDVPVEIYLGRRWERSISKFFGELANLRSKYNNLKNKNG